MRKILLTRIKFDRKLGKFYRPRDILSGNDTPRKLARKLMEEVEDSLVSKSNRHVGFIMACCLCTILGLALVVLGYTALGTVLAILSGFGLVWGLLNVQIDCGKVLKEYVEDGFGLQQVLDERGMSLKLVENGAERDIVFVEIYGYQDRDDLSRVETAIGEMI